MGTDADQAPRQLRILISPSPEGRRPADRISHAHTTIYEGATSMSAFTINSQFEGNLVANFRVAVTSRVRAGNGEFMDSTEYMNVVAWRGLAENAAASLHKGT